VWGTIAGAQAAAPGCPEGITRKSLHGPDDASTRLGEHPLMAIDLLYAVLRLSALVTGLALAAVLYLKGGWEAAAAALAIFAGMGFGLSLIVLLAAGDGTSAPTRR
jgi:hypothetical protein